VKPLAVALLLAGLACAAPPKPEPLHPPNSHLFFQPDFARLPSSAQTAWLSYGVARMTFLHERRVPMRIGQLDPGFDEEVLGRRVMASVWSAYRKGPRPALRDAYLDDLVRVAEAGYLREYVWTFLHRPSWGASPNDLDLAGFGAWSEAHLARHAPVTLVGVGTHAPGL
jgi:hypothetical protein